MKSFLSRLAVSVPVLSALLLQAAQLTHAHYGFPFLIVNKTVTKPYEYIREVSPDEYGHMLFPIYDFFGEIQVCGNNGTHSGAVTKTAKVEAGGELGFRVHNAYSKAEEDRDKMNDAWSTIWHDGPGQIYMSKAPDGDIENYTGDGDWFKVAKYGWEIYQQTSMNFTIPKTTPPGKYLVRVEQFQLSTAYNTTQMYINCAQVEVTGPGGGTPGPFIKFPGGYDIEHPGIWLPPNPDARKNYRWPGPAVWQG